MLLRLADLGITNAFTLLRLLPGADRDKDAEMAGIDPAPARAGTTWSQFLRSQAEALLAADFIESVTLTGKGLYVLAVIEHASRRVRILGATAHPSAAWVTRPPATVRRRASKSKSAVPARVSKTGPSGLPLFAGSITAFPNCSARLHVPWRMAGRRIALAVVSVTAAARPRDGDTSSRSALQLELDIGMRAPPAGSAQDPCRTTRPEHS
jgi:hypothetical protein